MNFSIFPMFYLFYGTYTKIFMIFGSAQDLLHKIKHMSKFCVKEKRKSSLFPRPARLALAQTGPRASRAPRPLPLSLARSLTGGSVPSSSFGRGFGELKHAVGELSASAVRCVSFPNLPRTRRHTLHPLSPILAPVATGTADGRLGQAHTGRSRRV